MSDVHVLAMVRGDERYVFTWTAETTRDVLRTFGRFASDPELSFTWYDAALLSRKVRNLKDRTGTEAAGSCRTTQG